MSANLKLTTVIRMLCAKTPMEVMNVNARMVSLVMESYAMVNRKFDITTNAIHLPMVLLAM